MTVNRKLYTLLPDSAIELDDFDVETAEIVWKSTALPAWIRTESSKTSEVWSIWAHPRLVWLLLSPALLLFALVLMTPIVNPSYVHKPPSYTGGNPRLEQVFIVAAIVDADLINGAWGHAVLELIEAVGAENAFLSIYTNDSGPDTEAALEVLSQKVRCQNIILSEHLSLESFVQPELSKHRDKVRRISYLAEVRNRAMRPFYTAARKFDKILFLNDVVFSGQDAADLLFATGTQDIGSRTTYHAACAIDFINPFKFYDTFATRDSNGYGTGLPFFPWFSDQDDGMSRQDVMDESDAVRVKSCWGGMVAFEARWFEGSVVHHHDPSSSSVPGANYTTDGGDIAAYSPVKFRSTDEIFWEASECCLIHADIEARARALDGTQTVMNLAKSDSHIVMNPFVRVAYSEATFRWLHLTRRFERLYALPHLWLSSLVGIPFLNDRQFQQGDQSVENLVWSMENHYPLVIPTKESLHSDLLEGCYQRTTQKAQPGGFCGVRQLSVLKAERKSGERMWKSLSAPALKVLCEA
ncbi:hypothetical protein D6D13_07583 [Aureobasidium pullulans]|uniref:Glycosyltransferase family 69 protein n=1 Tax=Aureobasidium pullulans TaxID=5580 RepID=A0A4V4IZ58_AURPU|nr:hypothetical protein D6D13_07583 [Aureobasidium pullulans]